MVQTAAGLCVDTIGFGLIEISVVVALLQVPFVNVYVTVYVPGVLAARLTAPVNPLIETAAGAE